MVESAAQSHEPHRVAFYLGDLAAAFHAFWNMGNDRPELRMVIADEPATTSARLFLSGGKGQITRHGLGIMGIKIGREVCGQRVCQCVSIAGAAVEVTIHTSEGNEYE